MLPVADFASSTWNSYTVISKLEQVQKNAAQFETNK